ncbi:DUF2510 domain-containing protein [Desertihabitans aurantiacus]|uniref:DUF2510 domain-containing protein n=1 Tax=Desertihabitans aurantiacus TaxID=2282477 RepID=UPI000DF7F6AF|nr:DUF2510 domain-containing protein [Desertihabitans aurantiacus]
MAVPGWYPDPSRPNGGYRWFDGTRWTRHTTTDPHRPAPASAHPARARRSWLVVLVAVVLAAALVGGLLLVVGLRTSGPSVSAPRPTVSAWDEVTTPPPTPTPDAGPTTPSEAEACEPATGGSLPAASDPGRVHGGPLSFPRIPGWGAPTSSVRFPHGRASRVTTLRMVEEELPWQSSAEVGELVLGTIADPAQAPELLLQCVLSSSFYTSVDVAVAESTVRPVTVDGARAYQLDARITFEHPRLRTTGSVVRIVVVDADVDGYWFSAVPQERVDLVAAVEEAAAGLRLED